jgi:hypothetical protein
MSSPRYQEDIGGIDQAASLASSETTAATSPR